VQFNPAEGRHGGRWPGTQEFGIDLELAPTSEPKALAGGQAAGAPLFSIETSDGLREYRARKERGVEFDGKPEARRYGTGVLRPDLYGPKIYLNQD
jgi:hypothetical protein